MPICCMFYSPHDNSQIFNEIVNKRKKNTLLYRKMIFPFLVDLN